jgi:hypothetical protein
MSCGAARGQEARRGGHQAHIRGTSPAPPRLGQPHPGRIGRKDRSHRPGHQPARARGKAAPSQIHRSDAGGGPSADGRGPRTVRGGGARLADPRRAIPAFASRPPYATHTPDRARPGSRGHRPAPAPRERAVARADRPRRRRQDPPGGRGGRALARRVPGRNRLRAPGPPARRRVAPFGPRPNAWDRGGGGRGATGDHGEASARKADASGAR